MEMYYSLIACEDGPPAVKLVYKGIQVLTPREQSISQARSVQGPLLLRRQHRYRHHSSYNTQNGFRARADHHRQRRGPPHPPRRGNCPLQPFLESSSQHSRTMVVRSIALSTPMALLLRP